MLGMVRKASDNGYDQRIYLNVTAIRVIYGNVKVILLTIRITS